MTWLTWRQFRTQAVAGFGVFALLVIVLVVTGPGVADTYESGIAACGSTDGDACQAFTQSFFRDHQPAFLGLVALVLLAPALIGLFWGAPLIAREIETGTHRLVWNQSVTRTRWLAVKVTLIGLFAVTITGLVSFVAAWWSEPVLKAAGPEVPKMTPLLFDVRGVVPIGYALFAFALGVTIGMLMRRTLPAMAVTVAVFTAVQIAMPLLVRPYLVPPTRTITAITADNLGGLMAMGPSSPLAVEVKAPDAGAWMLTNETLDKSGRVVEALPVYPDKGACAPNGEPTGGPPASCFAEINRLGYRQRLVYHGPDHFWPLQWIETGVYVVLGFGLVGFCFYRVRRNLS